MIPRWTPILAGLGATVCVAAALGLHAAAEHIRYWRDYPFSYSVTATWLSTFACFGGFALGAVAVGSAAARALAATRPTVAAAEETLDEDRFASREPDPMVTAGAAIGGVALMIVGIPALFVIGWMALMIVGFFLAVVTGGRVN